MVGLAAALLLLPPTATVASGAGPAPTSEILSLWPDEARAELTRLIDRFGGQTPRAYAVFDADNTIWRHDLEEALMPYLEARERLSLESLPPCLKPIEPFPEESLTSYYLRLCDIDEKICIPFIAEVFSGLTLAELREAVREMIRSGEPITTTRLDGEGGREKIEVRPPRIYPAQIQLIRTLMGAGIEVYVVSAALEELVRMVVSDPFYGIGLPPEKVIGVNLLLVDPAGEVSTGAQERKAGRAGVEWYFSPQRLKGRLTSFLFSPGTWYVGKLAAIKDYIHPDRRPVLVAGDAPNDHHMLFYSDVAAGGLRLFVRRKEAYWQRTEQAIRLRSRGASAAKADDTAPAKGWLVVRPESLEGVRTESPRESASTPKTPLVPERNEGER